MKFFPKLEPYETFGPSHAEAIAAAIKAQLLAQLPINPEIAVRCEHR
jgi:hypothetical protein